MNQPIKLNARTLMGPEPRLRMVWIRDNTRHAARAFWIIWTVRVRRCRNQNYGYGQSQPHGSLQPAYVKVPRIDGTLSNCRVRGATVCQQLSTGPRPLPSRPPRDAGSVVV